MRETTSARGDDELLFFVGSPSSSAYLFFLSPSRSPASCMIYQRKYLVDWHLEEAQRDV